LPNCVDGWIQKLLNRCRKSHPVARPSSQDILKILLANSATCRKRDLNIQKVEVGVGIRKALHRSSKFVELWRSLKLQKVKMLKICRR